MILRQTNTTTMMTTRTTTRMSSEQNQKRNDHHENRLIISPQLAFVLVSFCLGELGDGLNIFQGIYLVNSVGWNESSVGAALSLMGLTSLLVQPFAGDWVDKAASASRTTQPSFCSSRRVFLTVASIATAVSASTILKVRRGNYIRDHMMMYTSKVIEGIASSFIGPCLAALTLASFGPNKFDTVMASNLFWGHVGSVTAAVSAGVVAYISYPDIKYCFLVIGASALVAIAVVPYLPEGDPMMGRGFHGKPTIDLSADEETLVVESDEATSISESASEDSEFLLKQVRSYKSVDIVNSTDVINKAEQLGKDGCSLSLIDGPPTAISYLDIFVDSKLCLLCVTGFFYHFANANVLLILGEIMGSDSSKDGSDSESSFTASRVAIPFTAGAIVTAQVMMAITTWIGNICTERGVGRKPLFMSALLTLPIRCGLIILFRDASHAFLLSTQLFDGIGGGLFALIHPYLVADITFGTGRFNVVMGLTASCFGLGATLSNFLGQIVVEHFGHSASLTASLILSIVPIVLFLRMPETLGHRGDRVRTMQKI